MQQTMLMEKYPVFVLDLAKSETTHTSVDDIIEALRAEIAQDARVAEIAVFDHYSHTKGLEGPIAEGIRDAKNLVFCFGLALPNARVLAVRPRSIGVADLGDTFELCFLEPPMEIATKAMEGWCKALANKKPA